MTAAAPALLRGPAVGGSATRGSAIRLGAEIAARVLGLAVALLLSTGLGVEGFGTFSALSAAAALLAQVAGFGIQDLACPALVSGRLSLRAIVLTRLLSTSIALVVAGAVAAVGLPTRLLGGGAVLDPAAGTVLALLVASSVLTGWVELMGVSLRARERPLQEAALLVSLPGASLAGVAVALGRGWGLPGVAAALAVTAAPPVAVGALLLLRAPHGAAARTRPAGGLRGEVWGVLAEAWPLALNGGLAMASLRVELFALALLRGPRDAGLFALALRIVEALNAAAAAIAGGALPALTREALGRTRTEARAHTALAVAVLAVPAAAGLVLTAPRLLALWGAGYEASGPVLQVLALALVPMYLTAVQLHAMIAAGQARRLPILTAARMGVAVVLAPALAARAGASGAAFGFVGAELVLLGLAARAGRSVDFAVPLGRALAVGTAVAVPTAVAVYLAGSRLAFSLPCGLAAYCACLGLLWALARPSAVPPDVGYPLSRP